MGALRSPRQRTASLLSPFLLSLLSLVALNCSAGGVWMHKTGRGLPNPPTSRRVPSNDAVTRRCCRRPPAPPNVLSSVTRCGGRHGCMYPLQDRRADGRNVVTTWPAPAPAPYVNIVGDRRVFYCLLSRTVRPTSTAGGPTWVPVQGGSIRIACDPAPRSMLAVLCCCCCCCVSPDLFALRYSHLPIRTSTPSTPRSPCPFQNGPGANIRSV